jgi:hypothetical protein
MRHRLVALSLVLGLCHQGQADSYHPWAARRIPDPTGEFCASIVRTGGTRHLASYGPVEVQIVKRGPALPPFARLPPFSRAMASVYSVPGGNGWSLVETRHLHKVLPRPGDRVLGKVRLEVPPGLCLVSSEGRGIVLIDEYGYNSAVHGNQRPALRIVSANGKTLHTLKMKQLFGTADLWHLSWPGPIWEAAWIDDQANAVVLVRRKTGLGPKDPPPIKVIDWTTGTVRPGSLRHIEIAVRSKNRGSLPDTIQLAHQLGIGSVRQAVADIFADRTFETRVRASAAVYLAARGDRRAKRYLLRAARELARWMRSDPEATVSGEVELARWDYAYVVEWLPILVGADCIETLNRIGIEHGFDFYLRDAMCHVKANAQPSLLKLLRSSEAPDAQVYAAEMLGLLGYSNQKVVRALTEALSSKAISRAGLRLREKAAWALAEIGPDARTAVPKLKTLLKDSNNDVREAARAALQIIERSP